ncbi:MAG: peptidase S41, partial [Steroidobacteraceae bacterium]
MIAGIISRSCCCVALLAACTSSAWAVDPQDALLLAEPDISERHLAFVYDGDIWIANRDGSASRRLTTAEGVEARPHFSPDGATLAFSANYDGNVDVYVIPVVGGSPKRLTWHSAEDIVEGFDAGGRIVFSSQRDVYTSRDVHLFTVEPAGSVPERLPVPIGHDADVAPENRAIAYTSMPLPMREDLIQWTGYRGGSVSRIVMMNWSDYSVRKVPQPPARCNDLNPMWIAGKLYFNSDRNGEFNLHVYDPATSNVEQLTSYGDFPVVNASTGAGRIVYEQAGRLHVFDPATRTDSILRVAASSDLRETRPRRVSNVDYVRNAS